MIVRAAAQGQVAVRTAGWPIRLVGLMVCLLLLGLCLAGSLLLGTAEIRPATVYAALTAFDGSPDHLIVRTLRIPRALIALAVGASLAVAGAIMQGITRNPLASPGLLGINAGAALAVVLATFFAGSLSLAVYAGCAFLGAALAAVSVYLLGALSGSARSPLRLTIAGAAITSLLSSLTAGLLVLSQRTLEEIRFWLAGSVAGRDLGLLAQLAPFLLAGLLLAGLLGRQLTTLSLGYDVAQGLGQRTGWVLALASLCVVVLAGGAVALAGPIGFVGLVIPHVARLLVGPDYRWLLPYCALLGAILLELADITARLLIHPQELPVGVMTALIGGPVFLYLVWTRVRS